MPLGMIVGLLDGDDVGPAEGQYDGDIVDGVALGPTDGYHVGVIDGLNDGR